jgi:HipA-like protein
MMKPLDTDLVARAEWFLVYAGHTGYAMNLLRQRFQLDADQALAILKAIGRDMGGANATS